MKNPLTIIREEKNLSAAELGLLTSVSHMTIRRIEGGHVQSITPIVLEKLEQWGYSKEQLIVDFEKWKEFRIKQLEGKIG